MPKNLKVTYRCNVEACSEFNVEKPVTFTKRDGLLFKAIAVCPGCLTEPWPLRTEQVEEG